MKSEQKIKKIPREKNISQKILEEDLRNILAHTKSFWEELRNKNIFITGGTGFIGRWLLESFAFANKKLKLNCKAVVLTRNPEQFKNNAPEICSLPFIQLWKGDIRDFEFPDGEFTHIIHGATESSTNLNEKDPLLMFDTILEGTRRTLEFAVQANCCKFLFISSGAAYGKQPPELEKIPETYMGGPDTMNPSSAYGEGKRAGELLCAIYHKKFPTLEPKVARCFAFVGPFLPLDVHFAIGNFIRDAINNKQIEIKGDGTPLRSYMYAADLAIWLWTILFKGKSCEIYNVGGEESISIKDLAELVSKTCPKNKGVIIKQKPTPNQIPEKYVPYIKKVKKELKCYICTHLKNGIHRTYNFNK